ncbi:winged helix-turn-helix transcriptional regulator [Nocardia sp. CWNU-33]|uniref:winged helix-turn-helix transcriptional regulator n=1 Tax=Nocardia sp. CWNU-33 TaxID=3392117 RepID=UPI00398F1394
MAISFGRTIGLRTSAVGVGDHWQRWALGLPSSSPRSLFVRVGKSPAIVEYVETTDGICQPGGLPGVGISQRLLTLTLRRLERDGLVDPTVSRPSRSVGYALTTTGHS